MATKNELRKRVRSAKETIAKMVPEYDESKLIPKKEEVQKSLEAYILENYGERCPDFEGGCIVCNVWKAFDTMCAF